MLLAHSPLALRKLPDLRANPVSRKLPVLPDLILCGHTHGGQIALGAFTVYNLGYERAKGANNFFVTGTRELGGALMVVSNGVGESNLPIRIGAPRQIYLITLRSQIK